MTDTDIIKALECCKTGACLSCPKWKNEYVAGECNDILHFALDLINRQKAEIERLKISTSICEYRDVLIDNAKLVRINWENVFIQAVKSEAIKEFAERLKAEGFHHKNFGDLVQFEDIDNLVKEMTEGEK